MEASAAAAAVASLVGSKGQFYLLDHEGQRRWAAAADVKRPALLAALATATKPHAQALVDPAVAAEAALRSRTSARLVQAVLDLPPVASSDMDALVSCAAHLARGDTELDHHDASQVAHAQRQRAAIAKHAKAHHRALANIPRCPASPLRTTGSGDQYGVTPAVGLHTSVLGPSFD